MDHQELNRVAGRLALITGASGGIGAACARALAGEGANLALTYCNNKDKAEQLRNELQSIYGESLQITLHKANLADVDEINALAKEVRLEHDQQVDILVPNAGSSKRIVDIEDVELEDFEYTHRVNVRAPYLLVKHFVPSMKQRRWGRIVFISSIAAHGGGINGCHYAASKGGVTGMMKNLSARLAPHNISVNDVAPAMVGNTGVIPGAQWIPSIVRAIPLGRLGEPEEIAEVVRMFVKSGYVTGQSVVAGGGLK